MSNKEDYISENIFHLKAFNSDFLDIRYITGNHEKNKNTLEKPSQRH